MVFLLYSLGFFRTQPASRAWATSPCRDFYLFFFFGNEAQRLLESPTPGPGSTTVVVVTLAWPLAQDGSWQPPAEVTYCSVVYEAPLAGSGHA